MAVVHCSRCGKNKEGVERPAFYTGETARRLKEHACADCWREWIAMQIMIINEYRLDLMRPEAEAFLNRQVLAFFGLGESGEETARVDFIPPPDPS